MSPIDRFLGPLPIQTAKGYPLHLLGRLAQPGGLPAGQDEPLESHPRVSSSPPSSSGATGNVGELSTVSRVLTDKRWLPINLISIYSSP